MTPPRAPGGSGTFASIPRSVVFTSLPVSGVPIACLTTARAAMMYWSRNDGDTFKALAMLSKPSLISSRRQQGGRIHLDAEQVAHRVRVLGAIQAVDANTAGVEIRGAGLVQRVFEIRGQRIHGFEQEAWALPAAASCLHAVCEWPAPTSARPFPDAPDRAHPAPISRS